MNPNAPEHQPGVATDEEIIKAFANKIFSEPEPSAAHLINKRIQALNAISKTRTEIRAAGGSDDELPRFPHFSQTPSPEESNVGTGGAIHSRQGLRVLDQKAGTPTVCTDAYFQYVCDYANLWHSKNSGIDCRSPGTSPRFSHLKQSFHTDLVNRTTEEIVEETSEILSVEQFWNLRYLFVPISFIPANQDAAHVAVCAISPESKTVDYVCSGADSGLPDSPRSDGAHCIIELFQFLAAYLGPPPPPSSSLTSSRPLPGFNPSEWKFRSGAGRLQNLWRGDCGIYTVTHMLAIAFGYGYGTPVGAFPKDHQHRIIKRRKRYVQDIMFGGFKLYDPTPGADNCQYYPLLDTTPSTLDSDGFLPLPISVTSALPQWTWVSNPSYANCPSKGALQLHCFRNANLYPDYDTDEVSGPGVELREFLEWVEEMDGKREEIIRKAERKDEREVRKGREKRRKRAWEGTEWIDPTEDDVEGGGRIPRKRLWEK